ncbi:hypothetical protein BDA96_10G330800 [Sorghum bicolor]|uniref:Uncharacterized protein n=1 Tax=Sorghum bicolor TaxID=4558 RepID=A0A921Q6B3_SORBI|nr:hypothetical protein BDA96_10G330800 [Sorghum bicolor]
MGQTPKLGLLQQRPETQTKASSCRHLSKKKRRSKPSAAERLQAAPPTRTSWPSVAPPPRTSRRVSRHRRAPLGLHHNSKQLRPRRSNRRWSRRRKGGWKRRWRKQRAVVVLTSQEKQEAFLGFLLAGRQNGSYDWVICWKLFSVGKSTMQDAF